jgi:hypothetical protein
MAQSQVWQRIPRSLTLEQFEEFVLPHLPNGSRSPQPTTGCKSQEGQGHFHGD